ncbi:hypothetical protein [Clostridium sp. C8-1-8]|uniref:hypothetical protein n=1 Tax=Clostridium sp. C8-1-8 TaxID=2698831 RepID=UPI00136FF3A7|nr:hypothetical protein [Clostridium sp. C8-1-8]
MYLFRSDEQDISQHGLLCPWHKQQQDCYGDEYPEKLSHIFSEIGHVNDIHISQQILNHIKLGDSIKSDAILPIDKDVPEKLGKSKSIFISLSKDINQTFNYCLPMLWIDGRTGKTMIKLHRSPVVMINIPYNFIEEKNNSYEFMLDSFDKDYTLFQKIAKTFDNDNYRVGENFIIDTTSNLIMSKILTSYLPDRKDFTKVHNYANSRKEVLGYKRIASEYCVTLPNIIADLILFTEDKYKNKLYELIWIKRNDLTSFINNIIENEANLSPLEISVYEILYVLNKNIAEVTAPSIMSNKDFSIRQIIVSLLTVKHNLLKKLLIYFSDKLFDNSTICIDDGLDFQARVEYPLYVGTRFNDSNDGFINFTYLMHILI